MKDNIEFTIVSENEWANIVNREMTPADVTSYFYKSIKIRKFKDVLKHFAKGRDIKALLTDKLCEFDPKAKRDSIRKKVNNWLSGENEPTDRTELIKICFALKLNESEAQSFMKYSLEGGFHLRNPKEIAFLYCLRLGKSYTDAVDFIGGLKPFAETQQTVNHDDKITYTKLVGDAFAHVRDDESFHKFYEENFENFGYLHNTAYTRFMRFLDELIAPSAPLYAEKDKLSSIEQVVNEYLRMNLPLDKKTSKYNVIQKAIRSFWPDTTTIKNMRNRKIDVNRKVLLLLYVVTDGFGESDSDEEFLLMDMTPVELLEEHAWKINLMLNDCGMGQLDPRNPFDWLILYSLKVDYDDNSTENIMDNSMGKRLEDVLETLFHSEPE